ncbi:50S ribosomal protein L9 [Acetivibrio straminisolvens]|jgi:large subunit ribosomal protein L9|nr:50S ribosomal protein L9 [Acetivibrio straminisolvens]
MKVILKEDVKGLGKKESLVDVSDGYARNFLIPKGLAVEANASNMNIMQSKKEAEKNKKERELAQAKELAEKLKNIVVTLKAKAGENGKLFGSMTSKDVSDYLKKQHKLDIDKKKINLPESIKSLGTYEADVKLYPGVSAKLTVKIEQEQ